MSERLPENVLPILLTLFSEAYEGPKEAFTWFTTNEPNGALFGMLDTLSVEEASTPATAGGKTIASHTEHLRWSLALANAYMRGEQPRPDWEQSWTVQEVSESQWSELKQALRDEYQTLKQALGAQTNLSDPMQFTGIMALTPHAAYHLGSIRQMLDAIRHRVNSPA